MKIDSLQIEKAPENWSSIFDYRENIEVLREKIKKYSQYQNYIIIGNGGSITSFAAIYQALLPDKEVFILSTMEPRLIEELKKKYAKDNTLVIPISKSGNTVGLIESLLAFLDYPILAITNENEGTLCDIAHKYNWEIINHPAIGGRFSGGTATTIVPALLTELDADKILAGIYNGYTRKDEAYSLSKMLFDLEKNGVNEIYLPIYSHYLTGYINLIVQLMHESVCKNGKGQTFYGSLAPEAQHHTNQRFLGGRKNVAAIFFTYKDSNAMKVAVPDDIKDIIIRGENLSIIDGIKYGDALLAEYEGTKQAAEKIRIPNFTFHFDKIDEFEAGELVGFWHLVAFYSSILRDANPFDQPAVESSKEITISEIKGLKVY